ncbi:MAG TPA: GtrA family protein [Jatrophihabitans sp.]|jgi:putative flippase GtrA
MPTSSSRSIVTQLRSSWRILLKEISAFGLIGLLSLGIDLGIFAWLSDGGAVKAKFISTVVSTTFAYVGNRYLSFSHRARTSLGRETAFFFGINFITLIFSELVIALFVYPLGYGHGSAMVFVVNVATIGIGTIFRFWAYKRFVFLHPDKVHSADADLDIELAE